MTSELIGKIQREVEMSSARSKFFSGTELASMIGDAFRIHQVFPRAPHKDFCKHEMVPYGVHPAFSALLLLREEFLDTDFRVRGAKALLGHDFLKETTIRELDLPDWCKRDGVLKLIRGMMFSKNEDPFKEVWNRGEEVILLKLYDYTDNLMNVGTLRSGKSQTERKAHVRELMAHVRARYRELYVLRIAEALLK